MPGTSCFLTGQEWEVTTRRRGTGVICETWALEAAVIPAKAGIYSANLRKCAVDGLDSSRHGGTAMTGVSKGIPSQMTPTPMLSVRREAWGVMREVSRIIAEEPGIIP